MNSAGVSYDITKRETLQIMSERGRQTARPSDILEFLDKICPGGFYSRCARALGQDNYQKIYDSARADYDKGNKPYSV